MKLGLFIVGIAVLALLLVVGCSKSEAAQGATHTLSNSTVEAIANNGTDADLDAGVDDLSDLENMSAEDDALLNDSNLDQLTLE